MIFDLLTYGVMSLPALFAFYNVKANENWETHIKSAIVISLFALFFGGLTALESAIGLPKLALTPAEVLPTGIPGLEILQPFMYFIASMLVYVLVAFFTFLVTKVQSIRVS